MSSQLFGDSITRLKAHPVVCKVQVYDDRVRIYYQSGFVRSYVFPSASKKYLFATKLPGPDAMVVNSPIKVGMEFRWNPGDLKAKADLQKYFFVPRKIAKAATELEKELLVHELMCHVEIYGHIIPRYTDEEITNSLLQIENYGNLSRRGCNIFTVTKRNGRPGAAIVETFFDIADLPNLDRPARTIRNAFVCKKIRFRILQHLVRIHNYDINVRGFYRALYDREYGPTWPDPRVYMVVMKQIPALPIVDLSPWLGSKAIAAAILNRDYYYKNGDLLNGAIARGFAERVGLNVVGNPGYESILMLDNSLKEQDLDTAMLMRKQSKYVVVFVKNHQFQRAKELYPPTRMLSLQTTIKNCGFDYLFIYAN